MCLLSARLRFCCLNYMFCIGRDIHIDISMLYAYILYIYLNWNCGCKTLSRKASSTSAWTFPLLQSPRTTVCVYMCLCVYVYVCLYFLNQTFAMKLQLAMPISPIVGISFCGTVIKMQTAICHFQLLLSVFFLLPLFTFSAWLFSNYKDMRDW